MPKLKCNIKNRKESNFHLKLISAVVIQYYLSNLEVIDLVLLWNCGNSKGSQGKRNIELTSAKIDLNVSWLEEMWQEKWQDAVMKELPISANNVCLPWQDEKGGKGDLLEFSSKKSYWEDQSWAMILQSFLTLVKSGNYFAIYISKKKLCPSCILSKAEKFNSVLLTKLILDFL